MISEQDTNPREQDAGAKDVGGGELLRLLGLRDERISELSGELEDRRRRVARLEAGLEALGIASVDGVVVADVQVFWMVGGKVSEVTSARRRVREDGTEHELNFEIPAEADGALRIDLGARPGFWEVREVAVHRVSAEGTREASALCRCGGGGVGDGGKGFGELELTTGMLPLASGGGSEGEGTLRLYSFTDDPQMLWRSAVGGGERRVVRMVVRAMGAQWAVRVGETGVFQDLLRVTLSEHGEREAETRGRLEASAERWGRAEGRVAELDRAVGEARAAAGRLGEELELRAGERARLASTLDEAVVAGGVLARELEARSAERAGLASTLDEVVVAGGALARELEARDRAARVATEELGAARSRLELAARLESELAGLKLERERERAVRAPVVVVAAREVDGVEEIRRERDRALAERDRLAAERGELARRVEGADAERVRYGREAEALAGERGRLAAAERAAMSGRRGLVGRISRRLGLGATEVATGGPAGAMVAGRDVPGVARLFDERYYRKQAYDVGVDALGHYLSEGWLRGLDPHPLFSTRFYLGHSPDVAAAGPCPLVHYVQNGSMEGRSPHPLFDAGYYALGNASFDAARDRATGAGTTALEHYLSGRGGERVKGGGCPCPLFDGAYYAHLYADVAASGYPGLLHYATYGAAELRNPHPLFDARYYVQSNPDVGATGVNPLGHYLAHGSREHRDPHPLFSSGFYLSSHPEVGASGMNALDHYLRFGWKLGWDPGPHFSVSFYLRENGDVAAKSIEPLTHFVQFGFREHRDPSAEFDVRYYLLANPAVELAGINPLVDFLGKRGQKAPAPPERFVRLVVVVDDERGAYAQSVEAACPVAVAARAGTYEPAPGDYVYEAGGGEGLSPVQVASVALCLSFQAYDFVVVSHGMAEDRVVGGAVTLSSEGYLRRVAGKSLHPGSTGRLMRLLPGAGGEDVSFSELGLGEMAAVGAELVVLGPGVSRPGRVPRRRPEGVPAAIARSADKPLVWAVPIQLAVGGVERNMVEVLRELADRFEFLVVTTERLRAEQGSLHHQAAAVSLGVFDLGEIAPPDLHLDLLATLRRATNPDVVWTCNGSPWLAEHSGEFKAVLGRAAVVDQQVYDAEAGWIAHFEQKPSLKAFDRYVAINSHIRRAFVDHHGIAESRVDLIHHMIDDRRFSHRDLLAGERAIALGRWKLPEGRPLFAQVGRLTAQKQPLVFLSMAREALAAGDDAHFVLVGSGELAGECDAFISRHGLNNVTRVPFIEDPSAFFPLVSGLLLCSAFEGLPIVVLESLACGIPVLSTDVGDVKLVLGDYGSGMITGEGESMYAALLRFREGLPGLTAAAAEHAAAVRTRFSTATIGQKYAATFRAAMSQRLTRIDIGPESGLTVVMPSYNRAATLQRTIRSCLRFSAGLPIDYVIVDDGSRDETPKLLESLAASHRQITFRRVPNGGPGRARNLGASLARRDAIIFMGDDAEPTSDAFFTTHLDLHRRNPDTAFAVLGKMVWPDHPDYPLSFTMAHIQGTGGEQFGYADFVPYQQLDWRFFYTANISLKRRRLADWMSDGFHPEFRFAAWEDSELAYRLSASPPGLRLLYAPSSLAHHHHPYTVDQFISRQITAGMMLKVMLGLHPELTAQLLPAELRHAIAEPLCGTDQTAFADIAAVLEGLKAWARLLDTRRKIGSVAWHDELLFAVFDASYYQGYLMSLGSPSANLARAYERLIDRCYARTRGSIENEFLGYATRSNKLVPTG